MKSVILYFYQFLIETTFVNAPYTYFSMISFINLRRLPYLFLFLIINQCISILDLPLDSLLSVAEKSFSVTEG